MHALGPLRKDILQDARVRYVEAYDGENARVCVDSRNFRVNDGSEKRFEPTIRIPCVGVCSPKRRVGVQTVAVHEDHGSSGKMEGFSL